VIEFTSICGESLAYPALGKTIAAISAIRACNLGILKLFSVINILQLA